MVHLKRVAVPALAVVLSVLSGSGARAADIRTERMAALGRLWADAKYFHPWLAYQDVDWDQALVAALPKAASAKSDAEYAGAVSSMLEALHDSATRVVPLGAEGRGRPGVRPLSETTGDGILVIALNPDTISQEAQDSGARLREASARIGAARAVVFDLRGQGEWTNRNSSTMGLLFIAAGLNNGLGAGGLRVPGQRSRMHSGLASPWEGGSVYFHSAFLVNDGAILESGPSTSLRPVVFLVDASSGLPPIAPALQAAGRARLVAEGGASDASLVELHRIELPGGVTAQLRVTELIYEDGTTGLVPDLIVPSRDRDDAGDQPLQAALALARNPGPAPPPARFKAPPYATPRREKAYAETEYPAWEYRLLAGFRIWAVFQYFFAYKDLMGEDWNRLLVESVPKLEKAVDATEYAEAVAEMVAHVHDSHASVSGSRALLELFGTEPPPVRTRIIEGQPVVTGLLDGDAAAQAGNAIGDVVLKVDGEDASERLSRLGKYIAASTPQSLENNLMRRWLNGARGTEVRLTIRDGRGQIREVRLARAANANLPWRGGDVVQVLPGNVGYADLDRLTPESVGPMFEKLKDTRAIIFDMRGYPQGTGWLIAPRLTERKHVPAARFRRPLALAPEGLAGDISTVGAGWDFVQYLPESDEWKYTRPTVMLIDERAMSQAEHAGLFFEAANGTKFVGSSTAGADGDVARFTVPGGITIGFSGHDVRHIDGRQLQRVGLLPDIEVKPTVAGIRAGRDEVLERALEYLGVRGAKLAKVGEAR